MAPRPRMESRTTAPSPTAAPSNSTLPKTVAPPPTEAPTPTTVHPEPGRVRHLDQVDRYRGVGLDVQVDLRGQVVPGQDVGVQHHDRVGRAVAAQGPGRVADAARGVQRLLLLHVVDRQPELPAVP